MLMSVSDLHVCRIEGTEYQFRTPDCYDPAKARRILTRQRVRRPAQAEFRVAALAGIDAMAGAVADPAEGERQKAVIEEWYALLEPVREDDIDQPDQDLRLTEVARLEAERTTGLRRLYPEVAAIEANLERHWPAYAELLADRSYWDDVSRIEIVRLLLVRIAGGDVPRDDDGLLAPAAYQAIPAAHRVPLATFAFRLMAPDEDQRKN